MKKIKLDCYWEEKQKNSFQCNYCGHKEFIDHRTRKKICSWCGHFIYRDKKLEFRKNLVKKGIKT